MLGGPEGSGEGGVLGHTPEALLNGWSGLRAESRPNDPAPATCLWAATPRLCNGDSGLQPGMSQVREAGTRSQVALGTCRQLTGGSLGHQGQPWLHRPWNTCSGVMRMRCRLWKVGLRAATGKPTLPLCSGQGCRNGRRQVLLHQVPPLMAASSHLPPREVPPR